MKSDREKEPIKKTFNYKKAFWTGDNQFNLSEILIKKYEESNDNLIMELDYDTGVIRGTSIRVESAPLKPETKYLLLHITFYVDDSTTTTIPKTISDNVNKLEETNPPEGYNYLSKEVYALIKDNNLVVCQPDNSLKHLIKYINYIIGDICDGMIISDITDKSKMELIHNKGIKNLGFNSAQSEANMVDKKLYNKKGTNPVTRLFFDSYNRTMDFFNEEYKSYTGKDVDLRDYYNLSIEFNPKKNAFEKNKSLSQNLDAIVEDTFDSDESSGITIRLKDGTKISSNKIVISQSFDILPYGNTLNVDDVFNKLKQYFNALNNDGTLINDG